MSEGGSTVELAMVLLDAPAASVTPAAWCEALAALRVEAEPVEEGGAAVLVSPRAGGTLAMMAVAAPVPAGDLEPFVGGTFLWPDAGPALRGHTHHVIVTWMGGPEDPARRKTLFALVVAATAELLGAVAIYAGPVCFPTALCGQVARGAWAGEPPVPLWVHVDAIPLRDGRGSALTRGLRAFDHREVHVTTPDGPEGAWDQAMAIASYVVCAGAVLEPGHTIGATEDERVEVVLSASPDGAEEQVLRMEYP